MIPSRYFINLTQPEIAAQFKKNPLVILPAGSVEQHGPHLPTGTDIYAANVISHAVAERMDGLVLPGGPLGVTPMHMPFEGTITLSPETYQSVVVETGASTAKHGAKRLMILNWHEGNIPSLTHGGEIEALAVLAYQPDLVHLDRIDYSSDHSHGRKWDKLRRTRSYQPVLRDIKTIAETGWYGSPEHATAAKGVKMLNDIADAIAKECGEIFVMLDEANGGNGGTAEIKHLKIIN